MKINVAGTPGVEYIKAKVTDHYLAGSSRRGTQQHIVSLLYDGGAVREGVRLHELSFEWMEDRVPLPPLHPTTDTEVRVMCAKL